MRILQTTTVTTLGRVYLGKDVMMHLDLKIGDRVQLYCDDRGRIYIAKVVPPEAGEG